MEFDAYGFKCKMAYGKLPKTRDEGKILEASFLGVDCTSLTMLAYIKSWFESYKYNKIGSLKNNTLDWGTERGRLRFSLKTKDGEKFVLVEVVVGGAVTDSQYLDYQQVSMVEIAVSKCLSFLDTKTVVL
jgi:hypothetical protein